MDKLKLLDLFSGIGGFSLGLERTGGFETVAFCEIEPFPRKILNKHWPEVPQYEDIRDLTAARLRADGIAVDAICGGFPCQDVSLAGQRAGLGGSRSSLWSEYDRLVGELRPSVVFVENVPGLLSAGADRVLGDFASRGYDAVWETISANAVGAPHIRERVCIIAYARSEQHQGFGAEIKRAITQEFLTTNASAMQRKAIIRAEPNGDNAGTVANTESQRIGTGLCSNGSRRVGRRRSGDRSSARNQWAVEPAVDRVAHGVPHRVDRLKGLGNAFVPQIPELLGNAYLESIGRCDAD